MALRTDPVAGYPTDWSQLTAEWMTAALQRDFPAAVVASVELLMRDDGTNRRGRLGLTYSAGSGPDVIFAKGEGAWRESHARNGNLFNEPELFASRMPLPVDHPHAYYVGIERSELDYLILMEDITRRGGDLRDATRPMTVNQVEDGVRGLARLHSRYWDLPVGQPGLEWLQTWEATPGWQQSLRPGLPVGRRRAADLLPGSVMDIPDDDLLNMCMRSIETFSEGPLTLLHADPHIGNTYVLPGDRVGLLDWQVCRRGSWAQDLAYFVVSALEVADRREAEDRLLDSYLESLEVPAASRPSPDEVRRRYQAVHPYGLVVWIVTHQGDRSQSPAVCRALIERYCAACVDAGYFSER